MSSDPSLIISCKNSKNNGAPPRRGRFYMYSSLKRGWRTARPERLCDNVLPADAHGG